MAVSKKDAQNQLRAGGRRVFQSATAEIYDRHGPRLERQTGAGMRTNVYQLLDPRLNITPSQRAIGNCFGAFYEQSISGGGSEFLREYVDSTPTGGGGYSESRVHRLRMVSTAMDALRDSEPFVYPKGKARGKYILGPHQKITPFGLAYMVCVKQRSLSLVAMSNGWVRIPVKDGKWGRPKVPDRQRKALADHLRTTLDIIGDAWADAGYDVPFEFGTVEVR